MITVYSWNPVIGARAVKVLSTLAAKTKGEVRNPEVAKLLSKQEVMPKKQKVGTLIHQLKPLPEIISIVKKIRNAANESQIIHQQVQ